MFDTIEAKSAEVRDFEYRQRWLFASLLVLSTFLIAFCGFGIAGMGPCGPVHPARLVLSAAVSVAVLFQSFRILSSQQRRLRLRTIPFYLLVLFAVLFISFQVLLSGIWAYS